MSTPVSNQAVFPAIRSFIRGNRLIKELQQRTSRSQSLEKEFVEATPGFNHERGNLRHVLRLRPPEIAEAFRL